MNCALGTALVLGAMKIGRHRSCPLGRRISWLPAVGALLSKWGWPAVTFFLNKNPRCIGVLFELASYLSLGRL